MTAAAKISLYLATHSEATKPEMCTAMSIDVDTATTAIRKLMRMGCVIDTGKLREEGSRRKANIFAAGNVAFDQQRFTAFDGGRTGRPRKDAPKEPAKVYEFASLQSMFFSIREAA